MRRQPDDRLSRWLEAELADDERAAEEALGALFAAAPRPAPRPGFAERVMLAAALPRPAAATPRLAGTGLSTFVLFASSLAAATLVALLVVQPLLGALGIGELGPSMLLQGFAALVAKVSQLSVAGLLVLRKALELARVVSLEAARSPGVAGGVILFYCFCFLTFRALSRLVARERNFRYASA
jgi:hypothetical protein